VRHVGAVVVVRGKLRWRGLRVRRGVNAEGKLILDEDDVARRIRIHTT
jgi:hypothetical protein